MFHVPYSMQVLNRTYPVTLFYPAGNNFQYPGSGFNISIGELVYMTKCIYSESA